MNLRLAIYEMAARHNLDTSACARLMELVELGQEPESLTHRLGRGVMLLGAVLSGLGVVFWIAANWESFGRAARFFMLEGLLAIAIIGALLRPGLRIPFSVLAFAAIGGLFAYFGQTYQTGADPWQLFALWAALSLPMCLSVRSDALWTGWALITMTAITLWVHAHTGHSWRVRPDDLPAHLAGWITALVATAALTAPMRKFTGAGAWSLRLAVTLATLLITVTAFVGLFQQPTPPHYYVGLLTLAGFALMFSVPALFDIFNLSAISLGLNIVAFSGIARYLLDDRKDLGQVLQLLVLGLIAAGMLAATVSIVMRIAAHYSVKGGRA